MEAIILNGKKIVARKLQPKDLNNAAMLLEYANALRGENLFLLQSKKLSLKEEKEWIRNKLAKQKNRSGAYLVLELASKIGGMARIELEEGKQNHFATVGCAIANGLRGTGLGSYLMKELIDLARTELDPRPRFVQASIFADNLGSLALAKKFGFKKVALLPKQFQHNGRLIDDIILQLYL